jgi:putative ABC transport system permease protein
MPALLWINLTRNKRRTILTFLSVMIALFLFSSLEGVLDTLAESIKVGSETKLIVRNKVSLVFPMPLSYRDRIAALPGVKQVGIANWFGGQDPKDRSNFYAQFAVDDAYLPMYAKDIVIIASSPPQAQVAIPAGGDPRLASYYAERNAAVVGEKLMKKNGWKLGQTVNVSGTIYPGTWPFVIRAVYAVKRKGFSEETLFFRWDYLSERGMGGQGQVGFYTLEVADPDRAADVGRAVDALFVNSSAATLTESEQAFQAGFVSMYGNVPFVLRVIGLAVVFAILLVAANTMVMAIRERTREIGVLKTLGFSDGTIFRLVVTEAAAITLLAGILGALLAKLALEGGEVTLGGFLPPMTVYWGTIAAGIAIAALLGAVSGLIPAWQASRLRIVDALRRVD